MRSQVQTSRTDNDADVDGPQESALKSLNSKCSWKGVCTGEGCKFRPLPLDKGFGDSCRLTTKYMVNSSGKDFEGYVETITSALQEKAKSYEDECVGGGGSKGWVCKRRLGQIIQSTAFVQAAEEKLSKLPAEEYVQARTKIAASKDAMTGRLSSVMSGDDTKLVKSFLQRLALHPTLLGDNLQNATLYTMKTLGALVDGSDEEKEEARGEIKKLTAKLPSSAASSSEEVAKTKEALKGLGLNQADEDWSNVDEKLDEALTVASAEGSSLVELDAQAMAANDCGAGKLVIYILLWLFLSATIIILIVLIIDLAAKGPISGWALCRGEKKDDD